jgi:hypothetical protein
MGRSEKLLDKVLRGTSDSNIAFEGLCELLRSLGFAERYEAITISSPERRSRKY